MLWLKPGRSKVKARGWNKGKIGPTVSQDPFFAPVLPSSPLGPDLRAQAPACLTEQHTLAGLSTYLCLVKSKRQKEASSLSSHLQSTIRVLALFPRRMLHPTILAHGEAQLNNGTVRVFFPSWIPPNSPRSSTCYKKRQHLSTMPSGFLPGYCTLSRHFPLLLCISLTSKDYWEPLFLYRLPPPPRGVLTYL